MFFDKGGILMSSATLKSPSFFTRDTTGQVAAQNRVDLLCVFIVQIPYLTVGKIRGFSSRTILQTV